MNRKHHPVFAPLPRRFSEIIALIFVSSTIFLFLHSQSLSAKIEEIQNVLVSVSEVKVSAHEFHHEAKQSVPDKVVRNSIQLNTTEIKNYTAMLNNTKNAKKETLFFNRVPKVGSQTIMDLLQRLSLRNNFRFHRDGTQKVETIKLTYYEENRLTTMIDMLVPPTSFVKHTCFSNFTQFGYSTPIYINIVRDPIERVISWFYYVRAPWYIVERKQAFPELPLPHPNWLKKDFEQCVRSGDRECQFIPGEYHDGVGDHRRQVMFFCGHNEQCVEFNGQWAMQHAKRNVEENYAVVGVLEHMNITLHVLEKYIPRFFNGASKLYEENLEIMKGINKNIYKPPVSTEIKDILRRNFTREIEFYEFCRQRLYQQHNAVS